MVTKRHYKFDYLVFVDTNVLLDFYKSSKPKSLLDHLESINHQGKLIMTEQVSMEFKKNRQTVLRNAIDSLKTIDKPQLPIFLTDSSSGKRRLDKKINRNIDNANKTILKLKKILEGMLKTPTNDPVYMIAKKLFINYTPYNLNRHNQKTAKQRFNIRRFARKRFLLGYPPRKNDDNSIGDAINWEWIIECAKQSKKHIVIVSRDTDYGTFAEAKGYINDWLLEEFRERTTSKRRQLVLTPHLSTALKFVGITISRRDETAEEKDMQLDKINENLSKHFSVSEELLKKMDRIKNNANRLFLKSQADALDSLLEKLEEKSSEPTPESK